MSGIGRWGSLLVLSGVLLASVAQAQQPAQPPEPLDTYHKVLPGDTLWSISEDYLGESLAWPLLQEINSVDNPRHLQPGQLIDLGEVDPFPATVAHISGDAWLSRGADPEPLTQGQQVLSGDTLQTGGNAFVTLVMNDASRVVLPSMSRVTLQSDDTHGVSIQLQDGEVESLVPKRRLPRQHFEVATPFGVIGVRGTHFRVSHGDQRSLGGVLEGMISTSSIGSQATRTVDAGQGVLIDSSGGVDVVDLLDAPMLLDSAGQGGDLLLALSSVSGAASYRAQLSRDPSFLTITEEAYSTDGQLRLADIAEGFYHLRVSALDEQGLEGRYQSNIIYHIPNQVHVKQGENDSWSFDWASSSDVQYRLQLSADPEHRQELIAVAPSNPGSIRLTHLPAGTLYWKLESLSEEGAGESPRLLDSGSVNVDSR